MVHPQLPRTLDGITRGYPGGYVLMPGEPLVVGWSPNNKTSRYWYSYVAFSASAYCMMALLSNPRK